MSWIDALLGRTRPVASSLDALFGMSTAQLTLETEFRLTTTGGAAVSFRPVSSGDFDRLAADIDELLKTSTADAPLQWRSSTDQYGYRWTVLTSEDFTNLVTTVHMISRELQDGGYGEQLLAAVFQFRDPSGRNVYWVYNYKRGAFYPFVPTRGQERDNALELRLSAVMKPELRIEPDPTRWFPLWGVDIS